MSIWIQESPSSKAKCPICRQKIIEGEIRIGGNIGSGKYARHYHLDCWLKKNKGFLRDLLKIVLPMFFGDDTVKSLLVTLELKGLPLLEDYANNQG